MGSKNKLTAFDVFTSAIAGGALAYFTARRNDRFLREKRALVGKIMNTPEARKYMKGLSPFKRVEIRPRLERMSLKRLKDIAAQLGITA